MIFYENLLKNGINYFELFRYELKE